MMHLFNDDMRRNPFPLYDQMRAASPVLHVAPIDAWMLFDYASVKRAMIDHEAFASAVVPPTGRAPDWLVFTDPPRHAQLRAIILRAFTPRSIAALEPRISALSAELMAGWPAAGEIDLVAQYAAPLPIMVIAEMLGIPLEDRARCMQWSEAIMNLSYSAMGGADAQRAIANHAIARDEMAPYLAGLIAARRARPRDDLLTRLVEAEVSGERLDEAALLGFFQLLLAAGTETTTNVISNAMVCLSDHPDQLARLRAAPDLMPSAIEEVVRFRSPAQLIFRQTRCDVEMHGHAIPAGKFVVLVVGSANRDPSQFDAPDRFDVTRAPNAHVAFGHGIHFCIGAALARLEARVALTHLLARFTHFELAGTDPWPPRAALLAHGPARLPIAFHS